MLAPGSYLGLLIGGVVGTSGEKKTPCIKLTFRVTARSAADGWENVTPQQQVDSYLYLSDAAWPNTERKLEALEFNGSFREPQFGDKAQTEGVVLTCKHDTHEGKTREKWDVWAGSAIAEMPTDVARVMEAKWRAAHNQPTGAKVVAKSTQKPAPPKAAPPPPAPAAPPPVPGNGTTREDAWARTLEGYNNDTDAAGKAWARAIAKVGKPESAMTAADWEAVASDAEVPF